MSAYTIEVSITPVCTACGKELQVGCAQSRPGERFPEDRRRQRVFVHACTDCFVWKGDIQKEPTP